jgi:hypothetical protein
VGGEQPPPVPPAAPEVHTAQHHLPGLKEEDIPF